MKEVSLCPRSSRVSTGPSPRLRAHTKQVHCCIHTLSNGLEAKSKAGIVSICFWCTADLLYILKMQRRTKRSTPHSALVRQPQDTTCMDLLVVTNKAPGIYSGLNATALATSISLSSPSTVIQCMHASRKSSFLS